MAEVLLVLLGVTVGGLVVWIVFRGNRAAQAAGGPQEAGFRDEVRADLEAKLEQSRKEAEASAAAARQNAQEELDEPIEDWMARRYGGGRGAPGAGDE